MMTGNDKFIKTAGGLCGLSASVFASIIVIVIVIVYRNVRARFGNDNYRYRYRFFCGYRVPKLFEVSCSTGL